MAGLVRRIQHAVLGSAGPEKVRVLLAELGIPAGGSGEDAMKRIRKCILFNGATEAELRDAFGDLGLTGGGGGDPRQALQEIRKGILR